MKEGVRLMGKLPLYVFKIRHAHIKRVLF